MAIDVSELKLSLCMNSRKIIIDKDIDENVNLELTYYINKILESDSFKDSKEPIQFIISSNGGTVYDGLSVVNQIEHLKSIGYVVQTINLCKAFSMAFVVCVVGNQRMSYKYSTFMYHDVSTMSSGKIEEIKEDIQEAERIKTIVNNIVTSSTKIKQSDIDRWCNLKYDKFFSAEEALEYGIIDKII